MPEYGALNEESALTGQNLNEAISKFPRSADEVRENVKSAWRRYLAEFLGTLLLAFLGE